jgi:hypothetical protein
MSRRAKRLNSLSMPLTVDTRAPLMVSSRMRRMSPLQRAYLRGLRRGKWQARRETALLVEEFELFSVESELGVIEEVIELELGLTRDDVVRVMDVDSI